MKKQIIALSLIFIFCFSIFGFAEDWHIPKEPYEQLFPDGPVLISEVPDLRYEVWNSWNEIQKYSFVSGVITGMLFATHDIKDRKEFFAKIGGMTPSQIVDTIDKFYKDYPFVRDQYWVFVAISNVLPRYRSGEKPID